MSIGLTRYSARQFALINFLSAQIWAAITIVASYLLGDQILQLLEWMKHHWYLALPLAALFALALLTFFKRVEARIMAKRRPRRPQTTD